VDARREAAPAAVRIAIQQLQDQGKRVDKAEESVAMEGIDASAPPIATAADQPTVALGELGPMVPAGTVDLPIARWQRLSTDWPWRRIGRLAGRIAAGIGIFYLVLIFAYRFINPPVTVLMLGTWVTGGPVTQSWVPIEQISPNLVKAVIASEDGRYCEHWGVDWIAMAEAWEAGNRGASTIPMQTSKNLFLGSSRTYLRKALEIPFSYVTSLVWGKRRMMELYLNIAEWGPGIYGAEAAARHHFKTSAAKLSPYQASLLAASLPNPNKRTAGKPGPKTRGQAARVSRRLPGASDYSACVL
jgi:monofunctional biosynthetic peptidoglycan transglycosylase